MSFLSPVVAFVRSPFSRRLPADAEAIPLLEFRKRKETGHFQVKVEGDQISVRDPEVGCAVTINLAQRAHLYEVFRGEWLKAWNEAQVNFQTW